MYMDSLGQLMRYLYLCGVLYIYHNTIVSRLIECERSWIGHRADMILILKYDQS